MILLFIAGHETTMNLIGNGTNALLGQRDQLGALARRPVARRARGRGAAALRRARCTSPAASRSRTSRSTATSSPAASSAVTLLAAANRDPARFDHPDRLDLAARRTTTS